MQVERSSITHGKIMRVDWNKDGEYDELAPW